MTIAMEKGNGKTRQRTTVASGSRAVLMGCVLAVGLAACASEPEKPKGMQSSAQLQPNPANPNGLIYRRPEVNYRQYTRFLLPPTQIYRGADASFAGITEQEKQQLANYMRQEFARALSERYAVVSAPGPGVVRIESVLVGVETNAPVLATVTRLTPAGFALNAVSTVAGQQGTFMGSATYGLEFYDAQSGQLIAAALEKRSPSAIDVTATLGPLDATRSAIREAASKLREAIDKIQGAR